MSKHTYQVVEFAGTDDETIVAEYPTIAKAAAYIKRHYGEDEIEELGVDILRDGSTEY